MFLKKSKSKTDNKQTQPKKSKKVKAKKEKLKVPKTVQQTIPYLYVYEDSGIIETKQNCYTKTYALQDINYQIAKEVDQEEMFIRYGQFLNSFDSDVEFQITINNKNIAQENFEAATLIKDQFDGFDHLRKEYNDMLLKNMREGRNNMTREKYLTVQIKADNYYKAETMFARLDSEINVNIKKIGGADTKPLTTIQRLECLHDIFNIGEEGTFGNKVFRHDRDISSFDFKKMRERGLSTKDCIAPESFEFKRDYMMVGNKYARALFLKDLPTYLGDTFVSEITNTNCNMLTSINLKSVRADVALKLVNRQMLSIRSNMIERQQSASKSGYDVSLISPELTQAQEDAKELLEDLTKKNQKMFIMNFTIVHFADSLEELNIDTESIESTARRFMCEIKTLHFQQERGLASALPLANNQLYIERTLTTESSSVFMPFVSQELMQKHGMFYGLNAVSKNLIMLDRKQSKNGNGFILGTPGSGKSFSAKREMLNVLLNTRDDVIVIDPESEYSPMAELLKGEVVRIAAGSNVHINPMDLDLDSIDGDDPITLKSDFIISLCETAIGDRYGLTAGQRSIIDRCVRMVYNDWIDFMKTETAKGTSTEIIEQHKPTLKSFYTLLRAQSGYEAAALADSLEMYVTGSLNVFAHLTNVKYDNRFVVYDIKDIGSTMKGLGLLVVLDQVWNRIMENRKKGKYTWVYIDEIYLLFKSDTSANFLRELYKRARKFNGIPTGITQNVTDLLESEIARTMISNCEFIEMLNQAPVDRSILAELLSISQTQISFVTNAAPGEGLIYNGSSITPFKDNFPKDTEMYKAMSTKPSDIIALQRSGTI